MLMSFQQRWQYILWSMYNMNYPHIDVGQQENQPKSRGYPKISLFQFQPPKKCIGLMFSLHPLSEICYKEWKIITK